MILNRIKELRKQHHLTQKQLSEKLFIDQTAISCWERGKTNPDFENQQKLADIFGVSIDYLLGRNDLTENKKSFKIPVLGYVAAGIPIEEIENILDYEELNAADYSPNYTYFGLKIKGDSMFPRIQAGDVVIVRKQSDVESGEIAIVRVNGDEATCKQLKKHEEGITLISFNPQYSPMFFTWKEVENTPVEVIGKVVELRGKF